MFPVCPGYRGPACSPISNPAGCVEVLTISQELHMVSNDFEDIGSVHTTTIHQLHADKCDSGFAFCVLCLKNEAVPF